MINNGRWGLYRWSDNNPALSTTVSSSVKSLLGWTISRYGYEVRANGEVVSSNVSGNWRPEASFDRINGDTEWMAGEILLYPRVLDLTEKESIEGYLAHKWSLENELPDNHSFKGIRPSGKSGFVLNGVPQKAGTFEVSLTVENQKGQVNGTFNVDVLASAPRVQTADATQIGSSSARLQADAFDLGGMDSNLSFFWSTDANLSSATETSVITVAETGLNSLLLSGLGTSTTYYYRAKLVNSGGVSNGDAISVSSAHHWELNDSGSIALDQSGIDNGVISGANLVADPIKGQVLSFDGDDDFVNLGDLDEMDQIDRFTLSLWFKRTSDNSVQASNHGVDNVLVAQSSAASNDNFEIGTQGSQIEIYIDSGTAATDQTVRVDAGIANDVWYHLALVYGSELTVYLDGVKKNTWTQYNGRLESSGVSPLSLGIARPNSQRWGNSMVRCIAYNCFTMNLAQKKFNYWPDSVVSEVSRPVPCLFLLL